MFNIVRCIRELLNNSKIFVLDFADVATVLKNSGRSYIFYGKAEGEHAILNSAKNAINSTCDIFGNCKKMLVGVFFNLENFSMVDINEASTAIQSAAHSDVEIFESIVDDKTLFDSAETIIIATDNINVEIF